MELCIYSKAIHDVIVVSICMTPYISIKEIEIDREYVIKDFIVAHAGWLWIWILSF
jgi:hypothetical protein